MTATNRISLKKSFLIGVLVLFASVVWGAPNGASETLALARVEVVGRLDEIRLPIYAHLMDAASHDYAVVMAYPSELKQYGARVRILDSNAQGGSFFVATSKRKGMRPSVAGLARSLHDDGRHRILRANPARTDDLVAAGLDLKRLDNPMVLTTPQAPLVATPAWDPQIQLMVGETNRFALFERLGNLSGETVIPIGSTTCTLTTRNTNSGTPIQNAMQYVYECLQHMGLSVSYHNWTYVYSGQNVVATKIGSTRPDEIVLVTAHLDDMPASGAAPGADDNASGCVAVLTAANVFSRRSFERTVRFVLFTGEEQGLLGSEIYAEDLYNEGENIVAVYNMDMIAWDASGLPVFQTRTRPSSNPGYSADMQIASLVSFVVTQYGLSGALTPEIVSDGLSASDHASFWDYGYAAVNASEDYNGDFSDYYHTSSDRRSTLNLDYFHAAVKASIGVVAHLAIPIPAEEGPMGVSDRIWRRID